MSDNVVNKLKDAMESVLGDKKTLIKILSIILILLIAVIMRIHEGNKSDIKIETADPADETEYQDEASSQPVQSSILFVDIGGAVEKPGVYQVAEGTRLFEVIDMAGGLSEDADADHVNRASFVEDGQKIIIPVKGSESTENPVSDVYAEADDGLININTASAEELKSLTGIGDVMAERIIEYRSAKALKRKEDIMSVDGIGSKTYENIKDDITV